MNNFVRLECVDWTDDPGHELACVVEDGYDTHQNGLGHRSWVIVVHKRDRGYHGSYHRQLIRGTISMVHDPASIN